MSANFAKLFFLLVVIQISFQQRIKIGKCPNVKVKENFNVASYMGTWYEYERTFIFFEIFGKCGYANYTLLSNNKIKVQNRGINKLTGNERGVDGEAYAPDPRVPAKLKVKFPRAGVASEGNYWVLNTDYRSFAVVYSCKNLGIKSYFVPARMEYIWILTRKRGILSGISKQAAYKTLKRVGGGTLNKQDQQNCNN